MRRGLALFAAFILAALSLGLHPGTAGAQSGWWDDRWDYRLTVTVNAAGVARNDVPAEARVDLGALLGAGGAPDPSTLRVVEVDRAGLMVDGPLLSQFDADSPGGTTGTLVFPVAGSTPAGGTRTFHVYLNRVGTTVPGTGLASAVELSEAGEYAGQPAHKIQTAIGAWYYGKLGGAFSSLIDNSGKDWISANPTPGTLFNGEYRGIPQMDDNFFHPAGRQATTTVVNQGPMKVTLRSSSTDGLWSYTSEIYPTFIRSTITKVSGARGFWFLYEGTPGGGVPANTVVAHSTAAGGVAQSTIDAPWSEAPHADSWAYFGIPGLGGASGRSLYLSHREALGDNGYKLGGGAMTVFGFGRNANDGGPLNSVNQTFTFGLMDTIDPAVGAATIASASRPLSVNVGTLEARPAGQPTPQGTGFVPVAPTRLMDTRELDGPALSAGLARSLTVRGRGGVPNSATAAVLNVTVIDPSLDTFLQVWPSGGAQPGTSSINANAHDVVPNLVTSPLGNDGAAMLAVSNGTAHLAVDLVGYYAPDATGGFHPVAPFRALDTRPSATQTDRVLGPEGTVTVDIAAALGVPGASVDAVALNVTAVSPTVGGYLTVVPAGTSPLPAVSNLNFGPFQTVPNAVTVGTDGGGRITVFNKFGAAHVVVDVVGWYDGDGSGARFFPMAPTRVTDTRERAGRVPVQVGETYTATVAGGSTGVPAQAVAVVGNLTVTEASGWGYVTLWPAGSAAPEVSNQNTVPGLTRANHATVKVGSGGAASALSWGGTAHVVEDLVGWFA